MAVQVVLLCASCRLLRPRFGVDRERGGFAPRPPVIKRERDVSYVGEFGEQAQREVEVLCSIHLTPESTVGAHEVGIEHREVA